MAAPILFSFRLLVCNARPIYIYIYIYNMHSSAGTTTLNLYGNLYALREIATCRVEEFHSEV